MAVCAFVVRGRRGTCGQPGLIPCPSLFSAAFSVLPFFLAHATWHLLLSYFQHEIVNLFKHILVFIIIT